MNGITFNGIIDIRGINPYVLVSAGLARLKSAAAQARNTELAIHVLSGGKGRFLARSWNE